jgi:hypothetical protein
MSLSGRQGGHQPSEPDEIEDSPEIVGERGQAEFGANILQATHQKCALVHPLLDRAKRMFDRLATPIENTGALREPRLHSVQDRFVLQARDRAKLAVGAFPPSGLNRS